MRKDLCQNGCTAHRKLSTRAVGGYSGGWRFPFCKTPIHLHAIRCNSLAFATLLVLLAAYMPRAFGQFSSHSFAEAEAEPMPTPVATSAQLGTLRKTHISPVVYSHYVAYRVATSDALGVPFAEPGTHTTVSRTMVSDATAALRVPKNEPHIKPGDRAVLSGEEEIDTTFVDFGDGMCSESRVLGMEIYLVTDQQTVIRWRMESEERVYLNRRVLKATAVVESSVIDARFTPEIPVPAGPGLYGGLPGLILMVTNTESG